MPDTTNATSRRNLINLGIWFLAVPLLLFTLAIMARLYVSVEGLTCSPNPDPPTMRIPKAAGSGQEILDEADTTHTRTDRLEAA